jgi:Tfp pilus assembly protein PilF
VRKTTGWFSSIATAAALSITGCSTAPDGTTKLASWHWPWSAPAAAPLSTAPPFSPETSLATKAPKLGPDFYVATARMYEKNGDLNAAEAQYQKALKAEPGNLTALLGYAHLQDSRQQFSEADRLYQEAIKQHPNDASVYNDRGLSYQGRHKFDDASKMYAKAIELQPGKQLYRNNMAIVLVELHRMDEAFDQLAAANGPAIAHYNIATLLHRKGADREAQFHYNLAAGLDPSLVAARDWSSRLGPAGNRPAPAMASAPPAAGPAINGQIADRGPMPASDTIRLDSDRARTGGLSQDTIPAEAIVAAGRQSAVGGQPATYPGASIYVASRSDKDAPNEVFAPSPPTIVAPPAAPAPQAPNLGVRYPQPGPAPEAAQAAVPPSPERLNELPRPSDALRPLPPVQ